MSLGHLDPEIALCTKDNVDWPVEDLLYNFGPFPFADRDPRERGERFFQPGGIAGIDPRNAQARRVGYLRPGRSKVEEKEAPPPFAAGQARIPGLLTV